MPGKPQAAEHAAPQALGRQAGRWMGLGGPAANGLPHHQGGQDRDGKHPPRPPMRKHQPGQRGPHGARRVVGNAHGRDGLRPLIARHRVDHRGIPRGRQHGRAASAHKHQQQHGGGATPAQQHQQRQQGKSGGLGDQRPGDEASAVVGVGQHAGGQGQQKHGQKHGRLHQRCQEGRTGQLHHQPGRCHGLHAIAHKEHPPAQPKPPESRLAQGAPQGGRRRHGSKVGAGNRWGSSGGR